MASQAIARRLLPFARTAPDPAPQLPWPHFPELGRLAFPMHLSSLAGMAEYSALTNAQRWRLALYDAVLLFSRCHAIDRLIARRLEALAERAEDETTEEYLLLLAAEKHRHAAAAARFCRDYGGRIYADHQPRLHRSTDAKVSELLLVAEILVLEEISMWLCRQVADDSTLWPLARELCAQRAAHQARHLAYWRAAVESAWHAAAPRADKHLIAARLRTFVDALLVIQLDVEVFRDTQLAARHAVPIDPFVLYAAARSSPARAAIRDGATRRLRSFFQALGVSL